MIEFVECVACSVKSGAPMLCPSCISNRTTINVLLHHLRKVGAAIGADDAQWETYINNEIVGLIWGRR